MQASTKANLYLLGITAIWGATFPLIRSAVADVDPYLFVTVRFSIASLIMLFLVIHILKQSSMKIVLGSLVMGSLNSIAYISQTVGLQTTSSSRSAFITGFCVILVPFISPFFKLGRPRILDIVCSVISLIGLYILTGADLHNMNVGDRWTFLCAITFGLQITALQYFSSQTHNYRLLTFYQLLFTIPLSLVFSLHTNIKPLVYSNVLIALSFCAIFATAIAFSVQTKYQKFTTANQAALIFSLEPVFAALIGYLYNHEILTKPEMLGGSLILISIMLPALLQLRRE